MAVVGVDEAGKGPVLGSMFAAAVRRPDDAELPPGLADSKQLSPERREQLAEALRAADGLEVSVAEIPVCRIDDPGIDMNRLTVEAHAEALSEVVRPGDLVRGDAADVDADRFARRVGEHLEGTGSRKVEVRAEHRGDERHAVVGGASIVAKVARDAHVAALGVEYGDVGSGYPSDPATTAFLESFVRDHGRLPDCARSSWATSRRALAAAEQAGLADF